ncbi:hypothetical protein HMPREF0527_00425 [Lactobacillus jensenii SJ-7A-US]|jgi:hypothetical protein|uniref:hypothetical protein n=1 Tax=Lactobacillus jensenii TaxID=109790 RepID=UPI0001B960F8|nr:hypothetical protein [Lactobacillus jensenii]EEX28190.1 hypothetical protein HMPREF0527_00425 [Lactobacillus jensenii SJ-7A-US]
MNKVNAIAGVVFIASLVTLSSFKLTQNNYQQEQAKADVQLQKANKQMINAIPDEEQKLRKESVASNAITLDEENAVKLRAEQLAQELYTYKSSKQFLNKKKSLKSMLTANSLHAEQYFPTNKNVIDAIKKADVGSKVNSISVSVGSLTNSEKIPVFIKVNFQTQKDDMVVDTGIDGISCSYNLKTKQFDNLTRHGSYVQVTKK